MSESWNFFCSVSFWLTQSGLRSTKISRSRNEQTSCCGLYFPPPNIEWNDESTKRRCEKLLIFSRKNNVRSS